MLFENRVEDIEVETRSSFNFPYHLHNNVEVLICTEGTFDLTCNEKRKMLGRGDVMIAFPGDVHAYNMTEYGEGIVIFFRPNVSDLISDLLSESEYENFVKAEDAIKPAESLLLNFSEKANFAVLYGYLHIVVGLILKKSKRPRTPRHISTFNSVIEYIAANFTSPISLGSISKHAGISESHLSRIFSDKTEGGFKNYISLLRIEKAKSLLKNTDKAVYEIMLESGFTDQGTFNRVFKQKVGCTPREYRSKSISGNKNEKIDLNS